MIVKNARIMSALNAIQVISYPKMVNALIRVQKEPFLNCGYANHVQKKFNFALCVMIHFAFNAHKIIFLNLINAYFARTNLRTVRAVIYLDALCVRKIITLTIRVTFALFQAVAQLIQ
jgi:hypothetical protein